MTGSLYFELHYYQNQKIRELAKYNDIIDS